MEHLDQCDTAVYCSTGLLLPFQPGPLFAEHWNNGHWTIGTMRSTAPLIHYSIGPGFHFQSIGA